MSLAWPIWFKCIRTVRKQYLEWAHCLPCGLVNNSPPDSMGNGTYWTLSSNYPLSGKHSIDLWRRWVLEQRADRHINNINIFLGCWSETYHRTELICSHPESIFNIAVFKRCYCCWKKLDLFSFLDLEVSSTAKPALMVRYVTFGPIKQNKTVCILQKNIVCFFLYRWLCRGLRCSCFVYIQIWKIIYM